MDFDIEGLNDTPLTILGIEFDSYYDLGKSFITFFLYVGFMVYALKFGNRLFSNTK